jgi:predicted enzyme related to lactoylglutathione lyase
MSGHLIAHVEIPTTDLETESLFLKNVFGWEFKEFGKDYLLFNNHKGIMVGLREVESVAAGDTTVFHVNIIDIDDVLNNAKVYGGKIKRGKTVIPAMGWYALMTDPDGNTIGLYQKN